MGWKFRMNFTSQKWVATDRNPTWLCRDQGSRGWDQNLCHFQWIIHQWKLWHIAIWKMDQVYATVSSLWMTHFPSQKGEKRVKIGYPPQNIPKSYVLSVLSSFFPLELLFLGCMPHFQHRQTQQIQMGLGQNWTPKNNPPNTNPSIPLWPHETQGVSCYEAASAQPQIPTAKTATMLRWDPQPLISDSSGYSTWLEIHAFFWGLKMTGKLQA